MCDDDRLSNIIVDQSHKLYSSNSYLIYWHHDDSYVSMVVMASHGLCTNT